MATKREDEKLAPIPTRLEDLAIPGSPRAIIADTLRDRIRRGVYPPRTLLPKLDDLEKMTGAARGTIRSAIKQLSAEGYVRSSAGIGAAVLDSDYWPGGAKHAELPS